MTKKRNLAALLLLVFAVCADRTARSAKAEDFDAQKWADQEGDQDEVESLSAEPEQELSTPLRAPAAGLAEAHPYDAIVRDGLGDGNWGVEFDLVDPNGDVSVLSQMNEEAPLMPASTMKVFTSWFAFNENLQNEQAYPPPYRSYDAYAATMLKSSVNPMAVNMLRLAGGPAEMQAYYAGLGLPVESFRVVDGAGLSVKNRASARLEASLLRRIRGSDHYLEYRGLLAEPGQTGTLRGRLLDLRDKLFAKTGTLTRSRVAALTGFVDADGGGTIVFSIIGNNKKLDVGTQRARIDRTVESVRGALAAPRLAAAGALQRQKDVAARLPSMIAAP
jgi:D-alanyl-D-alanine carboxypeptidase/D-alanyl-D-alanine-endopeptidase (penicillin-binding protein 4)